MYIHYIQGIQTQQHTGRRRQKETWFALQNFKILQKIKKKISKLFAPLHIYVRMCMHAYMYDTHIYFSIYNKKEMGEELIPEVFDFLYGADIGVQIGVNRGPKRESVRPYLWVSIYKPDLALLVFYPFGFIIIRLS